MKLFYRKYGYGPPMVILHGLFGSSDNWVSIAKKLSDSFTVYLPDQRNHGQSPQSDVHDYDSMRDDLFELTADLKLNKFFLAGHSMGGKTAIAFALKWPGMLNGLLIADISPFTSRNQTHTAYDQHLTILNTIQSIDLKSISARSGAESILIEKIPSEKVRAFILKNLQRTSGNSFTWKINAPSLLNNLEKIMQGIDPTEFTAHPVTGFPVTFLKGANSDYLPADDFNDIQKIFPGAEIIEIPNSGHWIHSDFPDEVVKYLKKLLITST
ncbi:MAG: alpha/beta fold hydrolase [Bacteroidales bacterium]|nr:alpha/beta fold hydrolase [Bacteroidales bacterium]